MTTRRYFELVEGTSSKFWEVTLDGVVVKTRYGRIGSDGQTTTKDEATTGEARALFDKLIREKTKKGYVETGGASPDAAGAAESGATVTATPGDIRALWERIAKGDKEAFTSFLSFFGGSPADKKVIGKIAERFKSARIEDEKLIAELAPLMDGEEDEDTTPVEFSAPYAGEAIVGVASTVIAACRVANGAAFESGGGGYLGYMGIDGGSFGGAGGWDPGAFDDDEIEGLTGALDHGQNWICFDAKKKNALGEPRLVFVSHEGGEPAPIKKANALTFGQVMLRIIAQYYCDEEQLDQVYN